MTGLRAVLIGAALAIAVAFAQEGLVRLVDASGARDQPAVVLVLLLSAFLGLLTSVVTRSLQLPGAAAPTVLVLGWIAVPPLLALIPSGATDLFAASVRLPAQDAVALVIATLAATATLAVAAERRR
jgi:hypothetical protein